MKYLGKNTSFMNCIYMTIDDYKKIIKEIFGSDSDVWYDMDGIWYDIKDTGKGLDVLSELSKYFDCEVTSAHADDCDFVGVWIAYNNPDSMKVEIKSFIDKEHQSHYWYGGECATIKYKGYTAEICALGDVCVDYEPNGIYKTHVKDKCNSGSFYDILRSYIPNDKELYRMIYNYEMEFKYGNWWECLIVDKDGNYHEVDWILESDYLCDAIEEVKAALDELITDIEENPLEEVIDNLEEAQIDNTFEDVKKDISSTFKIEMLCHDIAVDKSYKDEVFEKFSSLKEAQEHMHICAMDEVESLNDDSDTFKYVYDIEVVDENNLYVRAVDCITGEVKHVTDYKVVAYSED